MCQIKQFFIKLFRAKPVNNKPRVRIIYGPNFIAVADIKEAVRAAEPTTRKIMGTLLQKAKG